MQLLYIMVRVLQLTGHFFRDGAHELEVQNGAQYCLGLLGAVQLSRYIVKTADKVAPPDLHIHIQQIVLVEVVFGWRWDEILDR